jgi:hypothetical protein
MSQPRLPRSWKNLAGVYRFSVAGFLAALVLLLITEPFVQNIAYGELVESVLLTLVLVSAVLAVGHRRRVLWLAIVLVTPALAGKWLYHFWPERGLLEIYLVSALLFVGFIIVQLLHFVLRTPRVNFEVLCAGISTYLMMGLLWSVAYTLVASLTPPPQVAFDFSATVPDAGHLMNGFTSLYFSFITLSTVGYGDITPVSNVARMLAATEAVTGTLFVAIMIARLVSLYSSQASPEPADKSSSHN